MSAADKSPPREQLARTERPLIFSAPMVLALLAGRKTQTRRLIRGAPHDAGWFCDRRDSKLWFVADGGAPSLPVRVGVAAGDRLWVREAWQEFLLSEHPPGRKIGPHGRFGIPTEMAKGNISHVAFRADGEWPDHPEMGAARWRSPIHMPRWASRLSLAVTDVRVQRLQDISEADALAEGVERLQFPERGDWGWPQARYRDLWNGIHGADAWDRNPWVAAISFAIDAAELVSSTRAAA